jgi:predicted SprT family Zn-dependent metalloprotease
MVDKEFVRKRVEYWWKLFGFGYSTGKESEEMKRLMKHTPGVEFSNTMTSVIGKAYSFRFMVRFSLRYMEVATPEKFDEIVAHEVAHVFVDRLHNRHCRHGQEWKEAMISVGFPPNKYQDGLYLSDKYRAACGCKEGCYIGPIRMKRVIKKTCSYICRKCNQPVSEPSNH